MSDTSVPSPDATRHLYLVSVGDGTISAFIFVIIILYFKGKFSLLFMLCEPTAGF